MDKKETEEWFVLVVLSQGTSYIECWENTASQGDSHFQHELLQFKTWLSLPGFTQALEMASLHTTNLI